MNEYAAARIGDYVDDICDELDLILTRVTRNDSILRLEPEGTNWLIVDTANLDSRGDSTVMMRTPNRETCVRFARAFARKHPETVLDASLAGEGTTVGDAPPPAVSPAETFSVRVPDNVVPIREGVA